MVGGNESARFRSDKPRARVYDDVEDALSSLGDVAVSKRGDIDIRPRGSIGNALVAVKMDGDVREREGTYTVSIDYNITLSTLGWVIFVLGLLFLLLGLIVLAAPAMSKGSFSTAVRRALREVDD